MAGEKRKGNIVLYLLMCSLLIVTTANGGVISNFTLVYKSVASYEIVLLQNAIEDVGKISTMPVRPISLQSQDVPDRPFNVTARAVSQQEIEVNWLPVIFNVGNLTLVGYTVFYKKYVDPASMWSRSAILAPHTKFLIDNLSPFTTYTIRVLAYHQQGNGISSEYRDERTLEGVPSTRPSGFQCISNNPYTISLSWNLLESTDWNGFQHEYTILYRKYNSNSTFTRVSFNAGARSGTLNDLKPHTKYEIYLMATTKAGSGPKSWCINDTMEGVPDVGVDVINWELYVINPLEIIVQWKPMEPEHVNGILTGYKFCWGIAKNGPEELEYPNMECEEFDQYTTQHVMKYLDKNHTKEIQPYMQFKVQIAGMTQIGTGAFSKAKFIDTCTCPISIYAAWFPNPPYVNQISDTSSVEGIFPDYLSKMVDKLCDQCPGLKGGNPLKPSTLYWDRSKNGQSPIRKNEEDLKNRVSSNFHLHVSMFGRSEMHNFQSDFKFVSIIQSPGSAFLIRDPLAELDKTAAIMTSLASCWPAIIIIVVFSTVAGTFVWIADCEYNNEDFPNTSFIVGIYHGAYWAFVSMTTVGYGDKTPQSCMAQVIAIAWMLMGPIINGVVVGSITTSLTTINLETDPIIYGNKVEAISNSFEYNLVVRRNGKIGTSGKNYTDYDDLLTDLQNRVIDGIVIDSMVAADKADQMSEKNIKLSKIIPESSGWGIILSSSLLKLEKDIRSYVKAQEENMKAMVENRTMGKLTIKGKAPSNLDTGIIDPNSKTFKDFVYYGLTAYVLLAIFGFAFEYGFLRIRKRRIKPFGQAHREILESELSVMIKNFCLKTKQMLREKTNKQESELKRFLWKKGYSLGVDAWFKKSNTDEESLKKDIRYNEIMEKDLLYSNVSLQRKWKTGKNVVRGPIRVQSVKKDEDEESSI